METCTNCGASLRPGAKFCTTCGTRLNETPAAKNDGWGTPRTQPNEDVQETTVLPAVQSQDASDADSVGQSSPNSWSTAYGKPETPGDDPASRFISALDTDVTPVEDAVDTKPPADSSWETPAPVFTPPPPSNWSYSSEAEGSSEVDSENSIATGSTWIASSSWGAAEISGEDDVNDDVEAERADDQATELAEQQGPSMPPDELRDKAIELADELRKTVRLLSGGGEHDHGAAVMALTEASLNVGDFSDVRGVLAEVRNDPRDIETLTNLAGKIDRIEALLDEHKALADAIETAIKELNG